MYFSLDKYTEIVLEKMADFENYYHKKPKYLKVPLFMYNDLQDNAINKPSKDTIPMFMGLIVCETPSICQLCAYEII